MCYAGKNSMTFTEGINVVIGDNGYGKSKLYDAFYWVMYDQVFVPEKKEFQSTKAIKSKIISDKAKFDTKDGRVSAVVTLTFRNIEQDNVYTLERKYTVTLKDGLVQESNDSEFTLMKKELSYMNARMVTDEDEKRRIIAKILPPQIKDYLWFQGEQVESIIDFNRQDTLTKAINVLSSITRYDELKDIAIGAAKSANTEYDREVKRLSKDIGRSEELEKEKVRLEKIVQYGLDEEKELKNNLSIAEEKSENLLNKTKDAQEVKQLQEKRKGILKILGELSEMVNDKQLKFHRKMFRSKWVLKGTESLFHSYSERFSKYQQKKVEEEDEIRMKNKFENEITEKLKSRLPIDVPEPIYIQRMLDEEMCLVCDREAKKNSIPWLKIKELIDRNDKSLSETKKGLSVKQDFSDEFKRLYQNGLSLKHWIEEIDTDINESLKEINNLNIKIRELKSELQKIDEDIQKLLADTSLSVEGANDILAEYSVQNKYVKDFSEKVNKVIQQLDFNRET